MFLGFKSTKNNNLKVYDTPGKLHAKEFMFTKVTGLQVMFSEDNLT